MEKQDLINLLYRLTEKVGLVDFYQQEASILEKKDSIFRICDFDDTLFARKEQLGGEELLRLNRGEAGNTIITNTFGVSNFIKKYYSGVSYPKEILSLLNVNEDLILTAGTSELQHSKIRATGLQDYKLRVVATGEAKVLETIRYILFELRYIPSEVIVYEDRPQYFMEYRDLIEGVLGTKLTIKYVEMDGNDGYKKIKEI